LIGLSGAGDIMLSCFGGLSRNRQCGSRLAKGEKLEDIVADIGTVEGIPTLKVLNKVIKDRDIKMMRMIPTIHEVFFNGLDLKTAVGLGMENTHHHEFHGVDFGLKK
jgi:glycerol-3-phosphate dehydrogenase (NAD(P)+)